MSVKPLKSKNAALLNRLSDMAQVPYYATACRTLTQAEMAIVELERENAALLERLAAQAEPAPAPVGEYPALALEAMEPVACLVNADLGAMVWPISDIDEAETYCDEGEFPEPLYSATTVSALQARIAELEQDAARGEPVGWQPLATAPKDGKEFIVRYPLQMNCKQLVYWNLIHGFWMTKGEALMGLGNQQAEWHPLPEDEPLPKETP